MKVPTGDLVAYVAIWLMVLAYIAVKVYSTYQLGGR